ncbi:MAG: NAD-dependent epimerase/dehydratase family protein [Acidimicrobiia bacterium]
MPDVFITGGSGFVGGAVLRRLVADGRHVRALVRSDEGEGVVVAAGAEAVRGDLLKPGDWARSLRGCSTLYHTAGEVAMCDPKRLEVNVAGTRTVIAAAGREGVGRIVHTSSAATIGEERGTVGTEATEHQGHHQSAYARSKREAEQVAFSDAASMGIDLVAVNPSSVQGPGRTHGTARLFIGFLNGKLRWAVRTRLPLVFVDDAVSAHLLAEQVGVPGERYLVNGWSPTIEEAVEVLGRVAGVDQRIRYLPAWTLTAAATVTEVLWRAVGKKPPVCRAMAREVHHAHVFDGSKAERDLGLRYTPPEEWLARTVEWYRSQGLLPRS